LILVLGSELVKYALVDRRQFDENPDTGKDSLGRYSAFVGVAPRNLFV
jgi:hypothetical protein